MWIKWKYNDHGFKDFQTLEIPDDLDGYDSVEDYLCSLSHLGIPVWSERFLSTRIKWEKIELAKDEVNKRKITKLEMQFKVLEKELQALEKELIKYGG